jgi:unsaturated chondroitin disaccharide hydrolase
MLGLAQAARLSDEFVEPAARVTGWYLDHVPQDLVCYWDFDDPAVPAAPKDTSATAIAAAALVKLHALTGQNRYRTAAENTVEALSDRLTHHGGLGDGCYQYRKGRAIRNELIWGDYFLLEASLAIEGKIDTSVF